MQAKIAFGHLRKSCGEVHKSLIIPCIVRLDFDHQKLSTALNCRVCFPGQKEERQYCGSQKLANYFIRLLFFSPWGGLLWPLFTKGRSKLLLLLTALCFLKFSSISFWHQIPLIKFREIHAWIWWCCGVFVTKNACEHGKRKKLPLNFERNEGGKEISSSYSPIQNV